MTVLESLKTELEALPAEALRSVLDFVRLQKERGRREDREKEVDWLREPWRMEGFKPLSREEAHART